MSINAKRVFYGALLVETLPFMIMIRWPRIIESFSEKPGLLILICLALGIVGSVLGAVWLIFQDRKNWPYLLFSLAVFVWIAWPKF